MGVGGPGSIKEQWKDKVEGLTGIGVQELLGESCGLTEPSLPLDESRRASLRAGGLGAGTLPQDAKRSSGTTD